MIPRIYADFHNLDDENRLRLTCAGTVADLERHHVQFRDGMAATFYMDDADDAGNPDDILVDGIIHYDSAQGFWVAVTDWSSVRHASDEVRRAANGVRPTAPTTHVGS
jgi:hypothetical protein